MHRSFTSSKEGVGLGDGGATCLLLMQKIIFIFMLILFSFLFQILILGSYIHMPKHIVPVNCIASACLKLLVNFLSSSL